jgi:ketosteroid isomerase-like protein
LLRKDRALLDRLMAPEFTISDSDGHVRSKSEVLDALAAPDLRFERHQQGNIHISSYGNFAVATGTYLVRVRYGDQVLDKSGRYTRVYVRRAGRWQTLREQSSPFDDDDGLI